MGVLHIDRKELTMSDEKEIKTIFDEPGDDEQEPENSSMGSKVVTGDGE